MQIWNWKTVPGTFSDAGTFSDLARGIIGGIVLSTLVTLVLVPVFYVLIERLRGVTGRLLMAPRQ